uniref:Reverse transcriptase domain-containing protein n=1 Tax=Magallana gigas TaxID=29159 RepID=A0A8W8IQ73_MAGGI
MVQPVVLKKRHSLKGLTLLPVIRKVKDGQLENVKELARMSVGKRTEALQLRDIANAVMETTGEPMDELLELAEGQNLGSKCEGVKMKGEMEQDQGSKGSNSPLAGLYPMYSTPLLGAPGFQPYPFHPFSNFGTYSRPRGYRPMGEFLILQPEDPDALVDQVHEDNGASMLINDNQVTAEFDKMVEFNPMKIVPRQKGEWVTISGGTPSLATHQVSAESVIEGSDFDMNQLLVYSPDSFIAGQWGRNVSAWDYVLERSGVNEDTILRVRKWLTEGVDVTEFFTRFKGNFRGKSFDSELPPSAVFPNSALCKKYHAFICDVLFENIRSGAIRVLGNVGECEMPHIVMPLTSEPSKPRLCHDDIFLSLWVKDLPFQLETLRDVHRLVGCNAFLITTDEKSGYDHVRLSNDSQGYFGLIFGGYVMVYTVIPFGFKASPFIYQTIGMVVTSYIRSRSISTVQYIDDRLAIANVSGAVDPYVEGCKVAYILVEVLTREVNLAISRAVKSSKHVCLTDELKEELEHWHFLDSWEGSCQWRSECHQQVMLSSDASLYKYGAVVEQGRNRYEISDFLGRE